MTDIEWAEDDKSFIGNEKYPALLADIKAEQLAKPNLRERWAKIASFDSVQSGRDTAYRLKGLWPEFEFISRKEDEATNVYARLKEHVYE